MDSQPDFTKLFQEYFAQAEPQVSYELRIAPNMIHDSVFISSLIHDAQLVPSKCLHDGEIFTIPLIRDRWERYRSGGVLDSCPSSIEVTAVKGVEWTSFGARSRRVTGGRRPLDRRILL